MQDAKDHALTVRLPMDLYEELRRAAVAEERTVAALLRLLARRYLDGAAPTDSNAR